MTTVLQAVQTIAKRCGISYSIASVIGNTDANVISILTKLEEAGKAIRDFADWPELQKEYTFSLVTSTASYALPSDFGRMIDSTQYNRTQTWPIYGPVNPETWQFLKSGIVTLSINQRYRVKGWSDTQFFLDATPDSSHNGDTVAYEYISNTWIRPKAWVASTSWAGIQYCSYNGNIYDRGGTGAASTGTSAPVHTSGSTSDGGITWTYSSAAYETFVHDSDIIILDSEQVILEAVWRWKMENGFAYEPFAAEARARLEASKADLNGATNINWGASSRPFLMDYRGLPEGDYG